MMNSRFLIWSFQFPQFLGERDDLRQEGFALDFDQMLYQVIKEGLTDQDCFIQQLHASHRISYEKPSQLEAMFPLFLIFDSQGLEVVAENGISEVHEFVNGLDFHLGFTENLTKPFCVVPIQRAYSEDVYARIYAAAQEGKEFNFEQIMFNKINCIK